MADMPFGRYPSHRSPLKQATRTRLACPSNAATCP